jgi:hypothetical protein
MAPARTGVTGLSLPWPAPRCSAGAARADVNGVERSSAARRIEIPEGLLKDRRGISVVAGARDISGVALVTGGFFCDGEPLPW